MNRTVPIGIMALSVGLFGAIAWLSWQTYVTRPTPQSATSRPEINASDPVLLAVGDIASCDTAADEAVAARAAQLPGTIATLGDTVYDRGTAAEFEACFDPAWGPLKSRIRPAVGNHEYGTGSAEPYFSYFGASAGQAGRGWYRYTLGDWSVFVLNTNCSQAGGCGPGSEQFEWLANELRSAANCSLAYFHHPRWSSGLHGSDDRLQSLWAQLTAGGVDVVLNGHDHVYERFAPLDAGGRVSSAGTRQFIVGTGGRSLYPFKTTASGSEVRQSKTAGLLRLQLHANGYSWEFLPVGDSEFSDRGSDRCRAAPAG